MYTIPKSNLQNKVFSEISIFNRVTRSFQTAF